MVVGSFDLAQVVRWSPSVLSPIGAHADTGNITSDEWTELLNVSDRVLDLIDW